MKVLVIGRLQRILDAVIPVLQEAGFTASGVRTTAEAVTGVRSGAVDALIIGAGVDRRSWRALRSACAEHDVRVIEAEPRHGGPQTYVREEVVPLLRTTDGSTIRRR